MKPDQARALVAETFPQPFDRGRFRNFAINLLNRIDETKVFTRNSQYIKNAFREDVRRFERLGTYTSPDQEKLDVLIVYLTIESKLVRARTAIRNFVADHLKERDGKDAALVAFVSPTEKQWRFSYVRMQYAAVEKEAGKVAVKTKLTAARRSSYIVGEGESCHTAQSRFLGLLQDTENHPTLEEIEKAFSVEAVTREFFEQYKALYLDLKDKLDALAKDDKTVGAEFADKNISTADFAKKLMGQIVFLYFLQKKGWLGVARDGDWGDGPHNFLRQLFDSKFAGYKNFFNDILEPLFYDTLATDRGHESWCSRFNCRIPFLNGGLFEPLGDYDWRQTDIIIPNSFFSNTTTTKVGDTGTGIFDVFDRYNFTVNEAEPLEKEVAIDPEMLGKVFENLLEVKERKSKGSFYTPREIVHYMCQESLINYLDTAINTAEESLAPEAPTQIKLFGETEPEQTSLTTTVRREIVPRGEIETFVHLGDQISHYESVKTDYSVKIPKSIKRNAQLIDDKLADIAVCDPAIGSGAFPVGMMQEIVRARSALTPYLKSDTDILVCEETADSSSSGSRKEEPTETQTGMSVLRKTRRNLPHWTKDGSIYWITFRLADSLPQEKLEAWRAERDIWISHHPEPWSEAEWKEYDEHFGERLEGWLDAGYGSCALARPKIRRIVQDCLLRFDGERLRLHAGVIMPNHVHLLLEPLVGNSLSKLLKGIKGASSHKVKQTFLSAGAGEQTGMSASLWKFWMDESFDHIVRSEAQYQHFRHYIADNPVKANLFPDTFWLYERDTDILVCGSEGDTVTPACASEGEIGIPACTSEGDIGIPACGSLVAEKEDAEPNPQTGMSVPRSSYHFKRHAIQNCLYGVDIDPGAVEIAKLRLWLSLVVDEDDVKQIKPLPNLDYKIVAGNSLMGFPFKSRGRTGIEKLKRQFFEETDHERKLALKSQIDKQLQATLAASKKTLGYEVTFDFEVWFSEVFDRKNGFDVVIANPPYVRQEAIKELKPALKAQSYECFDGVADLLVYFYERGVKLLRDGGAIALITSNKFYRAGYGEKLRGFLARELTLHRLIDFGDAPVFEAIAYASILTGVRTAPAHDTSALAYTWEKETAFERIAQIVPQRGQQIRQSELKPDGWRLESPVVLRLLEKLRRAGTPLGEYVNGRFYYGIKTGLNEAFVVDRATRDRLIREHKSSADILKPFLRGRDVKRWRTEFAEQYLIKIESSENKVHPWSGKSEREAEEILAATYPAIHAQFEKFRSALEKRDDQGKYFWELRSCAYWQEFEQPKLVVPAISGAVNVSLDREVFFSNNKTTIFVCDDAAFVSAVVNSKVAFWFTQQVFATKQGGFYDFEPRYSSQWPIPAATSEQQKPVERLVERILAAKGDTGIPACDLGKSTDKNVCVTLLEREIDELVYALYGLTPEEIKLVEGAAK